MNEIHIWTRHCRMVHVRGIHQYHKKKLAILDPQLPLLNPTLEMSLGGVGLLRSLDQS